MSRVVGLCSSLALVFAVGSGSGLDSHGLAVQIAASKIDILSVSSSSAFDYDPASGGVTPTYFNDCVIYESVTDSLPNHIQFTFAMVDGRGELTQSPLPVDLRSKDQSRSVDKKGSTCRRHAYQNGWRKLRLVAWVNVVDFADGTHWQAPPVDQMKSYILAALQKE